METLRWMTAMLLALVVHITGLLWFEPVRKSIAQPDTMSESIVVVLGQGTGETAQLAQLLKVPGPAETVEPIDITADQAPRQTHERLDADVEFVVDEVAATPATQGTNDPEAIQSLDAKLADEPALKVEKAPVQAPAAVQPQVTAMGDATGAADISVVATKVVKSTAVEAPSLSPAPVQNEAAELAEKITALPPVNEDIRAGMSALIPPHKNETAVEVVAIDTAVTWLGSGDETNVLNPVVDPPPKPEPGAVAMVTADPILAPAGELRASPPLLTEDEASDIEMFETSLPPIVEQSRSVQVVDAANAPITDPATRDAVVPEAAQPDTSETVESDALVETTPQAAVVLSLETVSAVDDRGAVTTVPGPKEVMAVDALPREQVAHAVTLEELMRSSPGGKGVVARYAGLLKGWLQENMHYPRAARIAGQEGVAVVRFVIDRNGIVRSIQLEQKSGHPILDREAVEMIERAEPFPTMPAEMVTGDLELRVPVSFHITDESVNKNIPPIYLE